MNLLSEILVTNARMTMGSRTSLPQEQHCLGNANSEGISSEGFDLVPASVVFSFLRR